MRTIILIFALGLGSSASADEANPELLFVCNWGDLTSGSIADGFDQGAHSSDPSGDGKGPGDSDQPRVGLANVVAKGDLQATCEFIMTQLGM